MSLRQPIRGTRYRGKIVVVVVVVVAIAIANAIAMVSAASGAASAQDAVSGTIEIIRAGTVGNQLHVSDMIEIQNHSTPPRTIAGENTFDVYLPARAKISSVIAAGPANVATIISAIPTPGTPGHYSVSFPLQPGATKFAFNYDLPYEGKAVFPIRHSYALQQLAIMIPPTMQFSSHSTAFQTLETGNKNYRVRAIAQLIAGPGPNFEISGSGALPSIRTSIRTSTHPDLPPGEGSAPGPIPAAPVLPRQNSSAIITSPAPAPAESAAQNRASPAAQTLPATPSWMILAMLSLGLAAMSAAAIRVGASKRAAPRKIIHTRENRFSGNQPSQTHAPTLLLEGLKEELFQLEAAKIRGTISHQDYDLTRDALEETVKRALRRADCEDKLIAKTG